jgi:mono/diheme cytochrome c family protein
MALHGEPAARGGWARLTALVLLWGAVFAVRTNAHDPITTKVTWSKEIVRIVERRCAGCHVAGGVAPMPLQTYEQARPWLKAVKEEVVARRMPKWPAARGLGDFANDRSLSPFEIELVAAWVDGGAPRGDARDLPRPSSSVASRARTADLTLKIPARATPPSGERRTVSLATTLARERWATGWRFLPGDAAIVQAEFTLADGTYLGNWVPAEDVVMLPPNTGARLPARATVVVSLWYRTARAQQDFPVGLPARPAALGLFLSASPPAREARAIDAPCGQTQAPDGDVFAIRPAAARSQASIGVAIRPPGGPPRVLAWLREFDPAYQATYRLRDAVAMPSGTRIDVVSPDAACHVYVQYTTARR